jgi:hypothetical protein
MLGGPSSILIITAENIIHFLESDAMPSTSDFLSLRKFLNVRKTPKISKPCIIEVLYSDEQCSLISHNSIMSHLLVLVANICHIVCECPLPPYSDQTEGCKSLFCNYTQDVFNKWGTFFLSPSLTIL